MVWTPFPESFVEWVAGLVSGSLFDTAWKAIVFVVLVGAVYALAQLGTVGAVIGFAILSTLIDERVRMIVLDIWNRNFWEV